MDEAERATAEDPERLLELARAFLPARLLLTATELDLFSHLEAGAATPDALAVRTGLPARGLEQFLNGLVACGLLVKRAGCFANTPEGQRFLTNTSAESLLPRFAFQRLLWERCSRLTEALRTG